jgi:GNAT superfamily N-acetyltransferase
MRLVDPDGALLDEILDQSHGLWSEGLPPEAYRRWQVAQARTPWARVQASRVALVDGSGRLHASARLYRHRIALHGREGWMCGIGAVLTPPPLRGRGHASALVERIVERARADGASMAALFSEIGTDFYRRLGFVPVPLDEVSVHVRRKDGAPAMLVRAGDERDLPAVAAMHQARAEGVAFALRRDAPVVHHALARRRLLAGLGPAGLRQVEFVVAEEGASAVAYAVLNENANGWTLEEAGDRDPAAARLGGMLQVLLAREPSAAAPLIRAWWPRAFPVPPQVELTDRGDARHVLMLRPLADVPVPAGADDVFYWHADRF